MDLDGKPPLGGLIILEPRCVGCRGKTAINTLLFSCELTTKPTRQTRSNGSKFVTGVISPFIKLDLRPAPPGRSAIWACKLGQKPRAGKSKGPSEEATAVVLLSDPEVPVKLHSKQQSYVPTLELLGLVGETPFCSGQ